MGTLCSLRGFIFKIFFANDKIKVEYYYGETSSSKDRGDEDATSGAGASKGQVELAANNVAVTLWPTIKLRVGPTSHPDARNIMRRNVSDVLPMLTPPMGVGYPVGMNVRNIEPLAYLILALRVVGNHPKGYHHLLFINSCAQEISLLWGNFFNKGPQDCADRSIYRVSMLADKHDDGS